MKKGSNITRKREKKVTFDHLKLLLRIYYTVSLRLHGIKKGEWRSWEMIIYHSQLKKVKSMTVDQLVDMLNKLRPVPQKHPPFDVIFAELTVEHRVAMNNRETYEDIYSERKYKSIIKRWIFKSSDSKIVKVLPFKVEENSRFDLKVIPMTDLLTLGILQKLPEKWSVMLIKNRWYFLLPPKTDVTTEKKYKVIGIQ